MEKFKLPKYEKAYKAYKTKYHITFSYCNSFFGDIYAITISNIYLYGMTIPYIKAFVTDCCGKYYTVYNGIFTKSNYIYACALIEKLSRRK